MVDVEPFFFAARAVPCCYGVTSRVLRCSPCVCVLFLELVPYSYGTYCTYYSD